MTTSTQHIALRHKLTLRHQLQQMRIGQRPTRGKTLLYACILCSGWAHASDDVVPTPALSAPMPLAQTQINTLAADPIWQRLILLKNQHAEVLSKGFYLSDLNAEHLKKVTPESELSATLSAFQTDPKALCQYPARYYWLSDKVPNLPVAALSACPNLPDVTLDVRMLLVNGYMKNPVSTFGHVLITVGQQGERQNLLDHAFNYGAIVPPGENGLSYATKGLLGFFNARFAASDFFKQDLIYAKTEQRDMWAYTLNLTPQQKALFIYHLAELKSRAIGYYFLKQNCAYRSGELLELITDIHTTERPAPWYPPIYIFDQIEEYRLAHPDFIKSVDYLPSDQTKLYANFALLPKALQQTINHAIQTSDLTAIEQLSATDRIQALEFLISYMNYKLVDKPDPRITALKRRLVQMRIQLPESETDPAQIKAHPSPALGEKPSKLAIGIGQNHGSTYGQLNVSVFNKDLLSPNGNPHDEFKMLDFSLLDRHGQVKLAQADFIHILKIEDLSQQLTGERKYSWQLSAGAKPDTYSGALLRPYVQAGIGAGYDFSPSLIGYSLLGAELNDSHAKVDLTSDTALVYLHGDLRAKLILHLAQRKDEYLAHETRFELQYRVAKNADIKLLLSNQTQALSYLYYW
jgi:hypothetical protein